MLGRVSISGFSIWFFLLLFRFYYWFFDVFRFSDFSIFFDLFEKLLWNMFIFGDWTISSLFSRLCSNEKKYVYPSEKWHLDSENAIFVDFAMFEKKNRKKKIKEKLFFWPKDFNISFWKTPKKYLKKLWLLGTLKLRAVLVNGDFIFDWFHDQVEQ